MADTQFVESSDALVPEVVPSLLDFAEDTGRALARGWYVAEIIDGYQTRNGKQIETTDLLSNKGDSRNLQLALHITPRTGEERNLNTRVNYRASDLTPERIAFVKQAREEFKGVRGRWSDADAQRSSLALAQLGKLEKAVGMGLTRTPEGNLNPSVLVSQKLEVRLDIGENGYNEVADFAKLGSYVKTGKS